MTKICNLDLKCKVCKKVTNHYVVKGKYYCPYCNTINKIVDIDKVNKPKPKTKMTKKLKKVISGEVVDEFIDKVENFEDDMEISKVQKEYYDSDEYYNQEQLENPLDEIPDDVCEEILEESQEDPFDDYIDQ